MKTCVNARLLRSRRILSRAFCKCETSPRSKQAEALRFTVIVAFYFMLPGFSQPLQRSALTKHACMVDVQLSDAQIKMFGLNKSAPGCRDTKKAALRRLNLFGETCVTKEVLRCAARGCARGWTECGLQCLRHPNRWRHRQVQQAYWF